MIAIYLSLACSLQIPAEETAPEIAGLQKAAADFVSAYNKQDATSIAALFTEDGEMIGLFENDRSSGRDQIQARYEQIFSDDSLHIAIEVDSVRFVAPNLAIEDGTFHLSPADDESAPPQSTTYTAVLMKDTAGGWQIASTRSLKDVTEAAGHLAALAYVLKGEWTHRDADGVRLDLAFGWDATGTSIAGEMLTTTADAEPQEGSIRISWDASRHQIVSWMFDAKGGFTHGIWTPTVQGWLIRSEGTTAEGESLTACQKLTTEGSDVLIWSASQRIVNGENIPDKTLRMVRQAPEPGEE